MEKNLSVCCIEAQRLCALSYEKKIHEMKIDFMKVYVEKDAEIERLKKLICKCDTSVGFICESCHEQMNWAKYQEAVKDIDFLMSHASTEWIGSWKLEEIKTKYGLDKKGSNKMRTKLHFVCSVNFFNDREKAFKDVAQFLVSNQVQEVQLIKGPYVSEDKTEMAYFIDAECAPKQESKE